MTFARVRQCLGSSRLLLGAATIALLAIPVSAQGPASRPSSRTCVLDEATLMAKSQLAIAMSARFRQVRDAAQASFDADSRRLKADDDAFLARRSTMSASAQTQQILDFSIRRSDLRLRGDKINRDLEDLDKALTKNVIQLALPAVKVAGETARCDMVVSKSSIITLNNETLDITERVILILNSSTQNNR